MRKEYIERIYAGWLAKIIGIRLGAPIEGWTYEKIKNVYGELEHYIVDYHEFAADDDSNGPLFLLRALENRKHGFDLEPQDVAEALLNYSPFEHGFFWWGGYGISTEHTAYLNLRNGIPAPRSGSIEQNGKTIAEQIGGQIFIDTWGLVTPGNPDLAAKYAQKAASVTHDGNGLYGGIFIAVCISYAFIENDIKKIIKKALSYIPADCEYAKVVNAIMNYYEEHPKNWRKCFNYIYNNFGYDKYPGNCHIIPNAAVIILALLYGEGDFSDTLNICNMCGWDTDCNVGNVATIMGVRNGLEGISYEKWRKKINDFVVCSSVVGSLNIMDIPFGASYIVKLAYAIAEKQLPEPWKTIINKRIDSCHFEYPGSTHAIRVKKKLGNITTNNNFKYDLINSEEYAYTGKRALKVIAKPIYPDESILVYKKTYYKPKDFHDSRYDPSFSPLVYPGQTIHGSAFIPNYGYDCTVCLYARDRRSGAIHMGEKVAMKKGEWKELSYKIPSMEGTLLDEIGFIFDITDIQKESQELIAFIDDLYSDGQPNYSIDFSKEEEEIWNGSHREISQFTRLKGIMYLTEDALHLSCADFAEGYTGRHDWNDYTAKFYFVPIIGEYHFVNFRVQGAIRSYAAGLMKNNKFAILKNDNGYSVLKEADFKWESGREYVVEINVKENEITASIDDIVLLKYVDREKPYLTGSIGVSVMKGSHCKYHKIVVS